MHYRLHWLHIGIILLLVLALPACNRSASAVMTPLPSEPPPTATLALAPTATPTSTLPVTAVTPSTATATVESTEAPSSTASLQAASATATKAVLSTEAACGNILPSRLSIDSYAYVNPDPPVPNNLRESAGENSPLMGDIQPGQAMKILDGPQCVAGSFWWKVQTLETDLTGWTAEGDGQNYWLIPCASESGCGSQ